MKSSFNPAKNSTLIDIINWDQNNLVPAIVQQYNTGEVLMLAWMNKESISTTLKTGNAHYYSRSRNEQWFKGETSGNTQKIINICLDCDGDTILLQVDQKGVACHTGNMTCFFHEVENGLLTN